MANLQKQLQQTRASQSSLARLSAGWRNTIIRDIAKMLITHAKEINAANSRDLKNFAGDASLADRLRFDTSRIQASAKALGIIARLPDPLGHRFEQIILPNGLKLRKISVPLGVVAVIYESRPNVTIDLVALAMKSGNSVVLKGGSESYDTNRSLIRLVHSVFRRHHVSTDAVRLIDPRQEWKKTLLNAHGLVDVIIPRGGTGLIKFVREHSRVPVIETGRGVCHIFVDAAFNLKIAVPIIVNAKVQRPGVCNALDTLVLHEGASKKLLLKLVASLVEYGVIIWADRPSHKILKGLYPEQLLKIATSAEYGQEFLALKMSIKTVKNFGEGLRFIERYTSGHSEAIITRDTEHAREFMESVDAAAVYHNASIRFTDGEEFGFGAEVGVSTQKLHTRGPMGADALTSYKWLIEGNGQVR